MAKRPNLLRDWLAKHKIGTSLLLPFIVAGSFAAAFRLLKYALSLPDDQDSFWMWMFILSGAVVLGLLFRWVDRHERADNANISGKTD
jgi:hypothetical protein